MVTTNHRAPHGIGRLAIFWQNFGPYHFSRIEAVQRLHPNVIGIEIASRSITYPWGRWASGAVEMHSLFTDRAAESVSVYAIYRKLRQLLVEKQVAVLFIPSYWPMSSVAAMVAARSVNVRIVMMNDSHLLTGRNSRLRLALKSRLVRVFDSALVAGSVHRRFYAQLGMPKERIFECYNTVDNTYFARMSDEVRKDETGWRVRLGLPRKFILSLGRFVKKKNLELIVQAFARARSHGRLHGHDLVFVGSGPEKTRLISSARRLGLNVVDRSDRPVADARDAGEVGAIVPESVYFLPFAQIDTLPAFYALASCFVLASRSEEWGLVVNEAMACGTPVLVSRFAGCAPDLVLPGVTGFRFNPDTSDELAWRIQQICDDEALRTRLGTASRMHIGGWSSDRFAENALNAAAAAMQPRSRLGKKEVESSPATTIVVLQTCFPDYREPVFEELSRRLGRRFSLISGRNYFTDGITPCSEFKDWHLPVANQFFAFKKFLWQHGVIFTVGDADIAVLELNPRILSNWVILVGRTLAGAPTLLWGHVWGRSGGRTWTNVLRLMMMRLADGVISYSYFEAEQLKRILPGKAVHVAPNSLIPQKRCRPATPASGEELTDFVYVGRLIADKKPMLLLRAFNEILPSLPAKARLVFVGAGAERPKLEFQAQRDGLQQRVIFHGHVNDEELLRTIYERAICSVSPGYVGLSAVQSFAHGVPMAIADREPHAPEVEICRAGENAVFFAAGNPSDLGRVLLRMWNERHSWLGRRAKIAQYISTNYSAEAMVNGYMKAIDSASARLGHGHETKGVAKT